MPPVRYPYEAQPYPNPYDEDPALAGTRRTLEPAPTTQQTAPWYQPVTNYLSNFGESLYDLGQLGWDYLNRTYSEIPNIGLQDVQEAGRMAGQATSEALVDPYLRRQDEYVRATDLNNQIPIADRLSGLAAPYKYIPEALQNTFGLATKPLEAVTAYSSNLPTALDPHTPQVPLSDLAGGSARDIAQNDYGIQNPYLLKLIEVGAGETLEEFADPTNIPGAIVGAGVSLAQRAASGVDRALAGMGAVGGLGTGLPIIGEGLKNMATEGFNPETFGQVLEGTVGAGFGALSGVGLVGGSKAPDKKTEMLTSGLNQLVQSGEMPPQQAQQVLAYSQGQTQSFVGQPSLRAAETVTPEVTPEAEIRMPAETEVAAPAPPEIQEQEQVQLQQEQPLVQRTEPEAQVEPEAPVELAAPEISLAARFRQAPEAQTELDAGVQAEPEEGMVQRATPFVEPQTVPVRTISDPKLLAVVPQLTKALKDTRPQAAFKTTVDALKTAGWTVRPQAGGAVFVTNPKDQRQVFVVDSRDTIGLRNTLNNILGREPINLTRREAVVTDYKKQQGKKTFRKYQQQGTLTQDEATSLDNLLKKHLIIPNIQELVIGDRAPKFGRTERGGAVGGFFSNVWYAGHDAKGKEYVIKQNTAARIPKTEEGIWTRMVPDSRHFAKRLDTLFVNGAPFDLAERVYTYKELGLNPYAPETMKVVEQMKETLRRMPGMHVLDVKAANIGFVPDPKGNVVDAKGKPYRPVISDYGAANTANMISRATTPTTTTTAPSTDLSRYLEGDTDFVVMQERLDTEPTAEQASQDGKDILENADKADVASTVTNNIGWNKLVDTILETRNKFRAKFGAAPIWRVRDEILKKGISNFQGKRLTGTDAATLARELGLILRANRKPFEITNILTLKPAGKNQYEIVYHGAWSTGDAKSVRLDNPAYQKALKEQVAIAKKKGWIIYSTHNHSGDSARASQPDVEVVSQIHRHVNTNAKGKELPNQVYKGEIITNLNTLNYIPAGESQGTFGFGTANANKFPGTRVAADILVDPILPEGRMLDEEGRELSLDKKYSGQWVFNPNGLARFVKNSVSASKGLVAVGIGSDLTVRQVMPMDATVVAAGKISEIEKLLRNEASSSGIYKWIFVSELDPSSDVHRELQSRIHGLSNFTDVLMGSMNMWGEGTSGYAPANGAGRMDLSPLLRVASEPLVPGDSEHNTEVAVAREKADRIIIDKFVELSAGKKAKKGIKADPKESMLQGELAQTAIGPPGEVVPGQGGPSPINTKFNTQGMEDATRRREVAAGLAATDLDRQKPGPSIDEIEAAYRDMTSRMSEDDMHRMLKLASTEKGMLTLFEKFNFYRNSVNDEAAAYSDYQQVVEAQFLTEEGKPDLEATAKAKADWVEASVRKQAALKDFADAKTNVARLLSFLKTLKTIEVDPELSRLGHLMSALRKRGVKQNVIDALVETYQKKPEEFAEALDKAMDPGWFKAFLQAWTSGLVSGPPTHLANIGSNAIFRGVMDTMNNVMTPTLDLVRATATGSPRERFYGETAASLQAYMDHTPFALRQWLGTNQLGFTLGDIQTLEGGFADLSGEGALQFKLKKYFGKTGENVADFMDIPFKALNSADTFFKQLSIAQSTYRHAYRQARKGGKSHAQAMQDFPALAQEIIAAMKHPTGPLYQKHKAIIEGTILPTAKIETFQEEMQGFAASGENYIAKHPALKLIIPFYRTPVNITKQTLRFFGYTKGDYAEMGQRLVDGKLTPEDIEELARVMLGGALTGAIGTAVMLGLATGGGPQDPRKEAELRKTGWQPYSIKIGDQWFNYQRLEPISGVLGIASDIAEALKAGVLDPKSPDAYKAIQLLMGATAENLKSKTFLAGLEGLFTAWHDTNRYGKRWIRQNIASLVPNIVGRTAQAVDPEYRDVSGEFLDPIKAKVPFWSKTLPGQTSPSGQPRVRPGGPIERFLSPIQRSKIEAGPEAKLSEELVRVGYLPSVPKSFQTIGGKQIPLTEQEIGWFKEAKDEARAVAAKTIKDPSYQKLPDNEEDPEYRYGMTTKRDVLERIYRRFRKQVSDKVNVRVRQRALKEQR